MTIPPVKLQPVRVVGIDHSRKTGIYVLSDDSVVYFAGNNIVEHNLESREQRFLPYTDAERGDATCVAVTTNAALMAFTLEMEGLTIHIVDIQNWKHRPSISLPIRLSGGEITSFTALAFSGNNKFLIGQLSGDSELLYFEVKGGTLLGSQKGDGIRSGVTCISFNPNDPASICCTGKNIFRRLTKGPRGFTVKGSSMTCKETLDIKSHIWTLDGRSIILALADGRLLQVDSPPVPVDIQFNNTTRSPVTHLVATQKGFLCVAEGDSHENLHFFERSGPKGFVEIASIPFERHLPIRWVSIGPGGDRVCVLKFDLNLISMPVLSGDAQGPGPIAELLPRRHLRPITGIDVASRKQLLVSCSEDHSIRVWNYETMQCEVVRFFGEEPLSIAFHPSGDWIVAGFTERLRVMKITTDGIDTLQELPVRASRECKFSHGGQYFAAVMGRIVLLFSSETFKRFATLTSSGWRVKTIAWSTDDNVLILCDANGSMALYDVPSGQQVAASNQQAFHFASIVCADAIGTKCYGVTLPDNVLRATDNYATTDQLKIDGTPCQLVMGPDNKCIFVSTRSGMVLNYCFPGSSAMGSSFPSAENVLKYTLHNGPITSLVISPDHQYLFTAGDDACIFMMKISVTETTVPK
jgi:WD40 repeat protein